MKVWSALFNIFAILIIIMLLPAYINISKVIDRDFDRERLDKAIDYATEATFVSALSVEDVGIDYTNLGVVSVNPGDAIDVFETMMCFNYDLSLSDSNKEYIESSISAIVLSGNDGFYITQSTEDDTTPNNGVRGGEYPMRWSVKIPYLLTAGNKTYALNIGKEAYAGVSNSGGFETPTDVGYPPGITKERAIELANAQIKQTIIREIENRYLNDESFNYNIVMPAETTKTGVNPIDGPGILILINGAEYASAEKMNAVSVAGYKTTKKVNIMGFTEVVGGVTRKYYCYQGQMDPFDIGSRYKVENYYSDTKAAAEAGYSPHYGLLAKKISEQ